MSNSANKHRKWWWIIGLAFAGIAAFAVFPHITHGQNQAKSKKGAPKATPVTAAAATKGNIDVYVTGLGSVTAYNTVTVRTRVDGELIKVAFREGQMVTKGDLIVEIDPRPYQVQLEQAEGQMARDQATLDNARVDLQRYQDLIKNGAITKQQLDTQVATVKQSEGTVKNDQGAIDSAKLQLTYCHITAPISGRIGLRSVDQGNIVHASDANGMAVITQLQPIAVIFNMPEDNLAEVGMAMKKNHALPAEAWDRELQHKLTTGYLLTLDNQIDQTTGTVKVKLEFANRDNSLFPNQFVNAKLLTEVKRGVVLVPNAAIQRSSTSTYVYIIKQDQSIEMRTVTTGTTEGDHIQITKGVSAGEQLVTGGADKLQQGMKVSTRQGGAASGKADTKATTP